MNDKERTWLNNASRWGGNFVKTFADACFAADDQNFELLRPALAALMAKYRNYSKSTA